MQIAPNADRSQEDRRAVREPSVNTQSQVMDSLIADPSTKYTLVENPTKSWALAPSSLAKPLKVTKEQVAFAEKRILDLPAEYQKAHGKVQKPPRKGEEREGGLGGPKKELQCHLREARSKAEAKVATGAAKAAKAEQQGYWHEQ